MRVSAIITSLVLAIGLGGCATWVDKISETQKLYETGAATKESFPHCYGYGCRARVNLSFSDSEWQTISALFEEGRVSYAPEEERRRIALAIGAMERIVGEKAGTRVDVGGSFTGMGKKKQLDCVDEMINTTTYVKLLIDNGLVKQHEIGVRLTNDFFRNGNVWPHTAMTIRERATGEEWAIDSWWLKNGVPPYIVTRRQWATSAWDQPRSEEAKKAAEARWATKAASEDN